MITLYPKKVFTFIDANADDKIYEIRIRLKNVKGALSNAAKVLADADISIESGALFYATQEHETGFWTMFVNASKATKNLTDVEKELKALDEVLDIMLRKPEPLAFDVMHFPLMHGNSKAIVLPLGVFQALWTGFETILLPPGLAAVLYDAGKKVGEKVANSLKEKYHVPTSELVNAIAQAIQATGWGISEIKQIDYLKHEATLVVKDCFEALAWRNRPHKTCHWTRGYFAGMMSQIFGEPMEAVETRCAAMGDEYCEFKLQKKL